MSIDSSSKAALHKGYKHWCPEVEQREDWDKDFNFVLIRSIEELKKLDVEHKFVAWDTETSGLNPDIDWLVGFSFSFDGKTGYYVPVKHDDIALGKEALDIFFSILSKAGTQFLYNCRFDQRFFEAAGYSLEGLRYYDVMNAIWLADTNVLMPSLKASERRFLGWIPKTFSETLGDATTFQHVPAEDAYKYACLAEDTLVTTDQGHEKISEISVGTLVDTSEGFKEVTATYDNGIREVLEVSLDGNLIECTPDHLLAVNTVLGPSYMRADELLPCASGYRGTGEIRELRSTKSVRREVFQDFHLMYYLLGLAWADGWMNHEKNSLSFHSSVKEQEFFTDFAKRFGTASVRVRKDLRKSPSGSMVRGIDLTLISPHLEEFFIQHGYTCNKPSRVYKDIPDNYFSDFLRGLYDGDGSSNHHTMVFMCHEALKDVLVNDIHRLFGILPTKSYFRHNVWSVSYGHSSSFLLWKSLYSTSSAFMQRKRDNAVCGKKRFLRVKDSSGVERVFHSVSEAAKFYHVCVSSLSHVAVGDRCHHKGICASYDTDFQSLLEIPEDIRCVVKPVGNRHVYDLQVKDVHNFRLANGIISHNCTDALGTYHLALISNQFYKESYPASKYDNDALYPMMRLENTPQRLDLEYLKSLCSSVETRIDESLQQVYQLAGCTFNVNSPAQFGKIMLERFGVDTGIRTPTGAMKADLKTLEAWMVKHGSKASPEVKDFLSAYKEYKKTVKFKSSYLDKYIKAAEDSDTFPIRFSYKFQSVPCLTENNTVLTKSRGFVSIKDVQSDDMIWTAWGYKRVLWNHSHEVDEFYRVILKNGMTLEGTGHHPVLVRKSPLEKVEYSGMTKDDVEWAGIQDLKPDEPVVINHTNASLSCQDSWRSSLARTMGYFYGHGRMTDGEMMSLIFDNPDLSYHYAGWMKSLFGDEKVFPYDLGKGKVEYSITRQTLAKFLVEHDVIPAFDEDYFWRLDPVSTYIEEAYRISRMPDTFRHFLVGYLDSAKTSVRALWYRDIPDDWADGVTKDRVVFVIPSSCKDVIIPMFWASAIGCKVTDYTFKTRFWEDKVTRVEVSDPYSLSNLLSLWNNQDVGLARFSCVELPKTFRLYSESRVQSVERVPTKNTVYDIEVEGVHEFVAGGIVTHNTGRLSCLSHDALVHTRQGLVPIVDITEEHDIEVSPNKFAKAKLVHTGEQDFVKIVMSSGKKIECTTDHRFLCPSDEGFVWRYARDLKVSDMLCRTPVTFTGCDINFEMFVYGFFLGDGSYYSKESKNKCSLCMFFCEKDHDAMMYIHDGLVVRGIPHSMRPCKDSLWVIELAKEGSRRLSEMFPVENVKQSERRVDFSYIHSKVDAFSVLAGVYQAEGEKYIRPDDGKMNSALNVTSYALVQSLQRLADYVGIRTKIHTIKIDQVKHPTHHKQWRLQFCVKSFRKYLDNSIPFRINTKKDVPKFLTDSLNSLPKDVWKVGEMAKFKALYHNKRYSLYSVMRLCEYSELPIEVFDYEQVVSIEPCGKKEAYTLAVDDPLHRYIAEGFIHHNCGGDKKNSFFTQNNVQCLEEDTSVITSEGIKPIKQIKTGDLVWTGSEFAPCQQLGSKTCSVLKISTDCGEVICSAEHLVLVSDTRHEIGEFRHAGDLKVGQFMKHVGKVLSSDDRYSPSRIERIESVGEAVCYDLFVPKFERFVANGFIVHNSTPKPHSLMVKGRKATQEEIDKGKDILGWYLSNDIPDDEAVGLVEGMDPDHFNLRRAFLPKDDDCYVVSIDMKAEELRLVANIYNEKTWADAFIHGKDVHKACYSPDTEFLVLDRGWMTADRITKGMKIAYYDPMDDEVRFTKAGERYSHEASEVYMHPTLFNVTDNHRMWIGTQDAGFRIVRASELKSQGNPKQKFRMKTAVGQRKSFQSIESHFGRKLGQYFCYGFMYFAPHYYDEEGFVHITLDSPCTKIPHDFALFLHSGDFSSTEFSVDRELSLGLRSLEASNPCTSLFSLAKTKYKDEPIFLQDFVYGMLVYLSSTKFNTLNLGDGSKVSGKVVVSSKEHADAIQWLLMLTGSTCRVDPSKSSLYGEGAYVLTIFSDVSSLPKSLGSTFGSVKQKNIAEKHLTYSCFSVPSGLLVTRYKGQITVNGNTAIKLFGEENYSKEARKKAKCLSGETLVQTSYGVLTLRSLYDGWKSGTYREDLKIATPSGMHNVLDVMNNGTKDVLCLNMSNGDTLEATPDHLVRSGNKWVPVSSLNEGDCIDADICLSEVKVYPQIPLSFVSGCFIPLNRDLAYLFGAVLGDGTIQKKNVYYFSEDEELLSEIERIVKGLGFEPRRNLHRIGKNGKPFFRISCGASRCREIFVGAGLVGDTGHKLLRVPDVVFKSPSECRFSFLQGIFDTDGTVSKLGNATSCGLCFCTSSQVFAKQCAMLCRSLGMMCLVSSDFNKTYNRTYYKVRIRASSIRQFVSLGGFKCVHKQNTLMEWLDAGLCLKTYKKHYCIQSISSGVREVFDVSVDSEEHAFLANGLVVHNCASFGILYGSGAQGFNSSFPEMSLDECRQFLAKFKEALPSIEQGQAENVSYAREHGTINTGYGRQRRVRSYFQSGDKAQIAFAERTVKNSVVQGTAADVLKLIFCRLWANVFKPYPDVTFMSTIHDEVNFSMPKRLAREVIPICMECMTIRRDDWPVTLECSLSIGRDSLGDLIPFTYNKETKEFTPEWEESSEVLKKRTGHVETESSDNESLDVEESDDPYFGLPPEACEF